MRGSDQPVPAGPFPDCFSRLWPWCRDLLWPSGEQTWGTAGPSSSGGGLGALRRLSLSVGPSFPRETLKPPSHLTSHCSSLSPRPHPGLHCQTRCWTPRSHFHCCSYSPIHSRTRGLWRDSLSLPSFPSRPLGEPWELSFRLCTDAANSPLPPPPRHPHPELLPARRQADQLEHR